MNDPEMKPTHIDMSEIYPLIDAIIASDPTPRWDSINHVSLVAKVARLAIDRSADLGLETEEAHIFLCSTIDQHGLAGNASQFRQWLASTKGGCRIPVEKFTTTKYK